MVNCCTITFSRTWNNCNLQNTTNIDHIFYCINLCTFNIVYIMDNTWFIIIRLYFCPTTIKSYINNNNLILIKNIFLMVVILVF